jgi:hypothetical protein
VDYDSNRALQNAGNNEITELVGYSKSNPYDVPEIHDLMIDTSSNEDIEDLKVAFGEYFFGEQE